MQTNSTGMAMQSIIKMCQYSAKNHWYCPRCKNHKNGVSVISL